MLVCNAISLALFIGLIVYSLVTNHKQAGYNVI